MLNDTPAADDTIEGAITEVKQETALVVIDPTKYAATAFEPFKRQLATAKRAANKANYDITTAAGLKMAKELRASFRDIRLAIENARKEVKAPVIETGKKIDAVAADLKAEVEPHEAKFDAQIKAEEDRKEAEKQRKLDEERARVEAIENRLAHIRNAPARLASADSATIVKELDHWTMLRLDPADYQEYLEDALTAVNTTLDQLAKLRLGAEAREAEARRVLAEREELARLKAEKEEADRRQHEEAAERERVAQAERDKAAAEKADLERQLAEMRAQLAASQPQPAAAPVVEVEPDPYIGLAPATSEQIEDLGEQLRTEDIPTVEDVRTVTFRRPEPFFPVDQKRPSKEEIIALLAEEYLVSEETVISWLKGLEL